MVDTNLIVVVVLLVTLIIGFFAYSFITNRIKLRKLKTEKEEMKKLANKSLAIFLARIIIIIEKNEELVENFVVGSKLKMSDLNNLAKIHLLRIEKDPIVDQILKSGYETEKIFFDNLNLLIKEKSNLWKKRNSDEIKYFFDFFPFLKEFDQTILSFFNEEKIKFQKYYQSLINDLKKGKIKSEQILELSDEYFETYRISPNNIKRSFWKKWRRKS
ncbi:MHJ_0274 family protein [Mesomycoplasma hyopneumoniae]|uniref:MHJ_0274 family protein n=1 Tax=Mesomycoplasma hyopneumoniae TaxID=2099 RepID=UPI00385771AF